MRPRPPLQDRMDLVPERFRSLANKRGGCSINDTARRAMALFQLVGVVEFMRRWSSEEVYRR